MWITADETDQKLRDSIESYDCFYYTTDSVDVKYFPASLAVHDGQVVLL